MQSAYLILYHKQSTSARTRFLRHDHGGICGPTPLPASARLESASPPSAVTDSAGTVLTHPAMMLRGAEADLQLPRGSLVADPGFRCRLCTDTDIGEVQLGRFTSTDPPFAAAKAAGASFIDLIQARGLPALEMQLLRLAYEHVLG
ncbi:MAG: hypothetical protein EA400_06410 [Chromatiaceae bacterium]|nr:MAG: hypothetical protein EA400_06410 [Chromatiaceae bacterium]